MEMTKIVRRAGHAKNRGRIQAAAGAKPGDPELRGGYRYVQPNPAGTRAERRLAAKLDKTRRRSGPGPGEEPQGAAWPDPQDLIDALTAAGFTVAGGRTGGYTRLNWPHTRDGGPWSVLVPLDRTACDYDLMMEAVVGELRLVAARGRTAQAALDALTA
jgi:hypothetical protein